MSEDIPTLDPNLVKPPELSPAEQEALYGPPLVGPAETSIDQGQLMQSVRNVLGESDASAPVAEERNTMEAPLPADAREVVDSDGWSRLIMPTPLEGVRVMFKGRNDLPDLESDAMPPVTEISLRPLYEDDPTGLASGAKDEAQYAYAASRQSSPRLISTDGGVEKIMQKSLEEAGGKDVLLVADETPEGFAVLFHALGQISSPDEMSEAARTLSQTSLELAARTPERDELLDQIGIDLTVALMARRLTPHEALALVYTSHVGSAETRNKSRKILDTLLADRLKQDKMGGRGPEQYKIDLANFIEATTEKNDFWVHRDSGVLRPGQKLMSLSAYSNIPRTTTHGCLNVAIDIIGNFYGSGDHGQNTGAGVTTIVSPVSGLARLNGLPLNYEAGDTFWENPDGMVAPEDSLYVTVSQAEAPADCTENEIWLPERIDDADIEQQLITITASIQKSVLGKALQRSDEEWKQILHSYLRSADEGNSGKYSARELLSEQRLPLFLKLRSSGEVDKDTHEVFARDALEKRLDKDAKIFDGRSFDELDFFEKEAALLAGNMSKDLAEQTAIFKELLARSLAEVLPKRRADYLQVWLSNMYVEHMRGQPTPVLETFGRGLNWSVPGQKDIIKADYEIAEKSGLSAVRHPDHPSSTNETRIYKAWEEVKNAKSPQEASVRDFIYWIKDVPIGTAFQYVRKGLISFDQTNNLKLNDDIGRG